MALIRIDNDMEKEIMYQKDQLDVADINHVEHNNDQLFDAFNDWPTTEVTAKDITLSDAEEKDRQRRSDSFGDEWQDHTSEVIQNETKEISQHKSLDMHNGVDFNMVDFTSLSKTVFNQCFRNSHGNNGTSSHEEKFNPHTDQ